MGPLKIQNHPNLKLKSWSLLHSVMTTAGSSKILSGDIFRSLYSPYIKPNSKWWYKTPVVKIWLLSTVLQYNPTHSWNDQNNIETMPVPNHIQTIISLFLYEERKIPIKLVTKWSLHTTFKRDTQLGTDGVKLGARILFMNVHLLSWYTK